MGWTGRKACLVAAAMGPYGLALVPIAFWNT